MEVPPTFQCRVLGWEDSKVSVIVRSLEPQRFWGTTKQCRRLAQDLYGDTWDESFSPSFVVREPTKKEAADEVTSLITFMEKQEFDADRQGRSMDALVIRAEMVDVEGLLHFTARDHDGLPPEDGLGEYADRPAWVWTLVVVEMLAEILPPTELLDKRRKGYWKSWA